MKINRTTKTDIEHRINSFKQIVTSYEDREYVTVTGTLDDILEYSNTNSVCVKRSASTEHLFPKWDTDIKYAVLLHKEVTFFADRKSDISGYGWYIHEGVIT